MSGPADVLDMVAKSDPKGAERLRKAQMAKAGHSTRFTTVWADEIELRLDQPGLVDGLLASTAMTVVYGESGAGKTFVAIDLACHVGAGKPWRGMTVEQGIVVYIAAESPESVQRRIWAWKQRHDVEHLPVLVVTSNVDMLNGDADELVALVGQIRESRGRVALTIVDTLARAMTGNENAPDDMGKFVAACGRIREASGGHVLVVHHCGKDLARGARGHSSLRAATDVELEVTNGEAGGCIRVSKHRDEAGGTSYGFKLETVELGTNSKGRAVTTCVTVETEAPEPKQEAAARPRRLNDKGKLFVQAVEKALKYAAERPPYHEETRGVTSAVTVTVARSYWRQLIGWGDASEKEKERSRQDWKRGLESALAADAVRRWGDYLWLPISGRPVTRDRDDRDNPKGLLSRHVTVAREVAGETVTGVTGVAGVTVCHGRHGSEAEPPEDGPDEIGREEEKAVSPQPDGLGLTHREVRERMARDTVAVDKPATVFWVSPLKRGVTADRGQLRFFYEGPYAQHDRAVHLTVTKKEKSRKEEYYNLGEGWPCWLVAVEVYSAPEDFPSEPCAFNEWLNAWVEQTGAKFICDYRQEAEAAGALDWLSRAGGQS